MQTHLLPRDRRSAACFRKGPTKLRGGAARGKVGAAGGAGAAPRGEGTSSRRGHLLARAVRAHGAARTWGRYRPLSAGPSATVPGCGPDPALQQGCPVAWACGRGVASLSRDAQFLRAGAWVFVSAQRGPRRLPAGRCPLPGRAPANRDVMAAPLPRPAGPEWEARPLPTAAQAALLPAGRALPHAALTHAGRAPAPISRPLRGGPRAEREGAAGGTAGLETARGPASPVPPGPGGGAVRTGAAGAVLRAGWREGVAAVARTRWLFNKPGAFTFGPASVYKNTENDRENILQARRRHRLTWGRAAARERCGRLGAKASRAPAGHRELSRRTGSRPGTTRGLSRPCPPACPPWEAQPQRRAAGGRRLAGDPEGTFACFPHSRTARSWGGGPSSSYCP